jgi:hypothetical protein
MTLFNLTILRVRLLCSYFLVTLLALLIFLYITNRHPGDDGAEDIIIFKGQDPPQVDLINSTGS